MEPADLLTPVICGYRIRAIHSILCLGRPLYEVRLYRCRRRLGGGYTRHETFRRPQPLSPPSGGRPRLPRTSTVSRKRSGFGYATGMDVMTSDHNWQFWGQPTPIAEPMMVPRGRVTGGSSAINGQVFLRGVPEDYDTWASFGERRVELPEGPSHSSGSSRRTRTIAATSTALRALSSVDASPIATSTPPCRPPSTAPSGPRVTRTDRTITTPTSPASDLSRSTIPTVSAGARTSGTSPCRGIG